MVFWGNREILSRMTRIELCTEGLTPETREAILDAIYQELRISPGEVSADGNFELDLVACSEDLENAPHIKIDGLLFGQVTAERVRDLVRGGKRRSKAQ
jgi:NADH:ubiquinone oxidoreductase subunit E